MKRRLIQRCGFSSASERGELVLTKLSIVTRATCWAVLGLSRASPAPLPGCTGRSARLQIRARESGGHARSLAHHTKVDSSALRINEMRRDPFGDAAFTDRAAFTDPFGAVACTAPVAFAAPACSAAASSAAEFITTLPAASLSDAALRAASLSAIEVLSPPYRDDRTRARAAGSSRNS